MNPSHTQLLPIFFLYFWLSFFFWRLSQETFCFLLFSSPSFRGIASTLLIIIIIVIVIIPSSDVQSKPSPLTPSLFAHTHTHNLAQFTAGQEKGLR